MCYTLTVVSRILDIQFGKLQKQEKAEIKKRNYIKVTPLESLGFECLGFRWLRVKCTYIGQ